MRTERDEIALRILERMNKRPPLWKRGDMVISLSSWAATQAERAYAYTDALLAERRRRADAGKPGKDADGPGH